jgi:3D (Asp-Asp-Asp) domain-containing protein
MNVKLKFLLPRKGKKRTYLVLLGLAYTFLFPQHSWAYYDMQDNFLAGSYLPIDGQINYADSSNSFPDDLTIIQGHTLMQISSPENPAPICKKQEPPICPTPKTYPAPAPKSKVTVITAYSSSYDETDGNPFITASGTNVRDGVVAANFLKIGTKVQIPALYGDKVFVVEDRMASYNNGKVDIWMPSKAQALQFGVKRTEIVVLQN